MRRGWVLLGVLGVGCTGVEPAPDHAAQEPVVPDTPQGPSLTVVGVVHEGGLHVCDAEGNERWLDRTWAVGFTRLLHDPKTGRALKKAKGQVVRVRGRLTDQPATAHGGDPPPAEREICPQYQMRADWELWPDGFRSRRGNEPELGVVHVEQAEVIAPIEARAKAETVGFTVTNPFDAPLRDAVLVAHYEGCYGKPMAATREHPLGTLKPGATRAELDVQRIVEREHVRGSNHRLDSVQLLGEVDGGALDLDVRTATLGAEVECPQR